MWVPFQRQASGFSVCQDPTHPFETKAGGDSLFHAAMWTRRNFVPQLLSSKKPKAGRQAQLSFSPLSGSKDKFREAP